MKLTLQIKLLPTTEHANALLNTLKECNNACNQVSDVVWQNKIFNQFKEKNWPIDREHVDKVMAIIENDSLSRKEA